MFIDNKGRIFGRINIVDLLIVSVVVIVFSTAVHTYRLMGTVPRLFASKWLKVEAVTFTRPELTRYFKAGDISRDKNGKYDLRINRLIDKDKTAAKRFTDGLVCTFEDMGIGHSNANSKYALRQPLFMEIEMLCFKDSLDDLWHFRGNTLFLGLNRNIIVNTSSVSFQMSLIRFLEC